MPNPTSHAAASTTGSAATARARVFPKSHDKFIRVVGWLSFVLQTVIIGTGGAVRLTGSGLGCNEWPLCTEESLVPTPELGIHGIVEFGNRTMTGVLAIAAVLLVVLLWKFRHTHRDLFVLATVVLAGTVLQAVVGGVVVLMKLHPNLVGFHYVVSLALVCVAAAFLVRLYTAQGQRERVVPKPFAIITHIASFVLVISVLFGIITTGAGPHGGDAQAIRNGFDATLLEHLHAWPGYALFTLTVVLAAWAVSKQLAPSRWVLLLLCAELIQIAVGLYQARNGLPVLAVGVHMVLAALTAAAMTVVVLKLKEPRYSDR